MNRQELFTRIATHLLAQNKRARATVGTTEGTCLYRYGSLKCAVGCLIPDVAYNEAMEGGVPDVISVALGHAGDATTKVTRAMLNIGVSPGDFVFLRAMQRLHDNNAPEAWRGKLEKVAAEHGLVMPS